MWFPSSFRVDELVMHDPSAMERIDAEDREEGRRRKLQRLSRREARAQRVKGVSQMDMGD